MARFGMLLDTKKCVGCMDCVVACKTENNVPLGYNRDWIVTVVNGKFPTVNLEIQSQRCNHCDNAPCVTCCPTGASHINETGAVVLVDSKMCIGCKACLAACPYDARFIHPEGYADKCTFCISRVEKGELPACTAVCPTHCITFGDLDDPESEVSRLIASRKNHQLIPEAGTNPRIYYLV